MRLGGWMRLWIVLVVIYGIGVAIVTALILPNERDLATSWASDTLDVMISDIKRTSGKSFSRWDLRQADSLKGKSDEEIARGTADRARRIDLADPRNKDLTSYKEQILALEQQHSQKLAALPKDKFQTISIALAVWVIPAIAALALGHTVGWIYRGFKGVRC